MYLHCSYYRRRKGGINLRERLYITEKIKTKLNNKHSLKVDVIEQVWKDYNGITLVDTREEHRTHPPTEWFIGTSTNGVAIKIVFVPHKEIEGLVFLKTAYKPSSREIEIYKKRSML